MPQILSNRGNQLFAILSNVDCAAFGMVCLYAVASSPQGPGNRYCSFDRFLEDTAGDEPTHLGQTCRILTVTRELVVSLDSVILKGCWD